MRPLRTPTVTGPEELERQLQHPTAEAIRVRAVDGFVPSKCSVTKKELEVG